MPLQIFRNGPQNLLLLGRLTTNSFQLQGGFAFPWLPTRGSAPGPCWGHSPQTPYYRLALPRLPCSSSRNEILRTPLVSSACYVRHSSAVTDISHLAYAHDPHPGSATRKSCMINEASDASNSQVTRTVRVVNHRLRGSASTVLTATGQVNGRWRILTPQNRNPWADCNKIPHNWLCPREDTLDQIWYKFIRWELLGKWVKYNVLCLIYLFIHFFLRLAYRCDNYERGNVGLSSIMMFQYFKLQNFKIKLYILSETSKWHEKEITNDEHKINNM